jgi:hypothetical protein
MLNRHELQELQSVRAYPCLTITLPTHRTAPDNRQDPIRVKNLVSEAASRLQNEISRRDLAPLLQRLDALTAEIDYRYTLDGLVLAVNQDMARQYVLPFPLVERVVVDETFFTRDLVRALNRTRRYWVLSLSEQPTRLYSATREHLEEIVNADFPMNHTGPGGEAPLPAGLGINSSSHRDERLRQFFRAVDNALRPLRLEDPLPLAIVGIDRHQAAFREVSRQGDDIIASVQGSYDSATAHDLGRLVWPSVSDGFTVRRRQVLDDLATAVGAHRSVSTLGEVWRHTAMGRGDLLLVEDGYHEPARLTADGQLELDIEDATAPDVLDDAVDEVITMALQKGGRVAFVEDGELSLHRRIALILRY